MERVQTSRETSYTSHTVNRELVKDKINAKETSDKKLIEKKDSKALWIDRDRSDHGPC